VRATLWDRFVTWLAGLWDALHLGGRGSPALYWAALATLAAILAALAARAAWLFYQRRDRGAAERGSGRRGRRVGGGASREPWALAQELAARGAYTDAAHALYRALLEAIERRERVRLHPSKTVGDYVRDLRARSSSLFGRFRDFARSYETVVYGLGTCDRERYERLRALAAPIVQPAGGGLTTEEAARG
jgi:Domain of unknown function (DUF4129)